MELTYKQLEETLAGHFRIHPEKRGTFRSRIKQLQRLKFPPGVNVGRGVKVTYNAEHLFQMATAFELIGCGFTAERATSVVSRNWPVFAAGFALAVQNLNRLRTETTIYSWLLTQSFGELQVDPFPDLQFPLSAYGWSRAVVGDDGGLQAQLLGRNRSRRAHCYATLVISDLTSRLLTAVEERGGVVLGRRDAEFGSWLPPEDGDKSGWLFINFNPWEEAPTAAAAPIFSTREIEERGYLGLRLDEMREWYEQDRKLEWELNPPEALKRAAEPVAAALSKHAVNLLKNGPSDEDDFAGRSRDAAAQDELESLMILTPANEGPRLTPLGTAVIDYLIKSRRNGGSRQKRLPALTSKGNDNGDDN